MWYGDLDLAPPTPEQYHENLLQQIDSLSPPGDSGEAIDPDTPTSVLESMIDVQNFIPLITDDYRIAFCQVTNGLPELCQTKIWSTLMRDDISIEPPSAPKKMSTRMRSHLDRWAKRKLIF